MKFTKPALGQQQLIGLMQQRGLVLAGVADMALARRALERIGYFRLSGFMLPFVVGGAGHDRHHFKAGTTISKIVALHEFDASMRLQCLEALGQIEVAVRASICDHLSRCYGPHWPLQSAAFKPGRHAANLDALAKAAEFDLAKRQPFGNQSNAHQFVTRYYAKYTDSATRMPPGWMVRECASFRTWAFLYEGLESCEQKQISDAWRYPSGKRIDHAVLRDWLHSLGVLRNRCAHHGRVTHKSFPFAPTAPRDTSVAHLFGGQGRDLRTLVAVISILLRCIEPSSVWLRRMFTFLDWQSQVDIGRSAGFIVPGGATWREDALWNF